MFYFVLPMVGRKLTFEILLLVDMVSSYSLELSKKNSTQIIYPKLLPHMAYLKAIEKVLLFFLINAYLHPKIYGM